MKMKLPQPTIPGMALVEITGTEDDVEALFDVMATATGWVPATTIESDIIPWADEYHAQTWACYMRPGPQSGPPPGTVDKPE